MCDGAAGRFPCQKWCFFSPTAMFSAELRAEELKPVPSMPRALPDRHPASKLLPPAQLSPTGGGCLARSAAARCSSSSFLRCRR